MDNQFWFACLRRNVSCSL